MQAEGSQIAQQGTHPGISWCRQGKHGCRHVSALQSGHPDQPDQCKGQTQLGQATTQKAGTQTMHQQADRHCGHRCLSQDEPRGLALIEQRHQATDQQGIGPQHLILEPVLPSCQKARQQQIDQHRGHCSQADHGLAEPDRQDQQAGAGPTKSCCHNHRHVLDPAIHILYRHHHDTFFHQLMDDGDWLGDCNCSRCGAARDVASLDSASLMQSTWPSAPIRTTAGQSRMNSRLGDIAGPDR